MHDTQSRSLLAVCRAHDLADTCRELPWRGAISMLSKNQPVTQHGWMQPIERIIIHQRSNGLSDDVFK